MAIQSSHSYCHLLSWPSRVPTHTVTCCYGCPEYPLILSPAVMAVQRVYIQCPYSCCDLRLSWISRVHTPAVTCCHCCQEFTLLLSPAVIVAKSSHSCSHLLSWFPRVHTPAIIFCHCCPEFTLLPSSAVMVSKSSHSCYHLLSLLSRVHTPAVICCHGFQEFTILLSSVVMAVQSSCSCCHLLLLINKLIKPPLDGRGQLSSLDLAVEFSYFFCLFWFVFWFGFLILIFRWLGRFCFTLFKDKQGYKWTVACKTTVQKSHETVPKLFSIVIMTLISVHLFVVYSFYSSTKNHNGVHTYLVCFMVLYRMYIYYNNCLLICSNGTL
jgi:hypothetical protein